MDYEIDFEDTYTEEDWEEIEFQRRLDEDVEYHFSEML